MATPTSHPGPSRRTQRGRAAFTLIEILIAIGVVVALIAVAVPTIVLSFGDRRLEAEAERLGAAVASLRAESVRQRETLALFLEPATGRFGGTLFIGPLESENDDLMTLPAERPSGWGGPTEEEAVPTRRIFQAERPLLLSDTRPSADSQMVFGPGATGVDPTGPSALESSAERIRIAVCSASGQILASRPLWLSDERAAFRVEVGAGVGNAIVSGPEMILRDPLLDEEPEAEGEPDSREGRPALPDTQADGPPGRPGADEPEER